MKAAFAKPGAGIAAIALRDIPLPQAGPGEALVRLKVATLNFRDLMALRGQLSGVREPEYIPLSDAVGEVVSVGPGVTRVATGDRVNPLFATGWFSGSRPPATVGMLGGPVDGVARQFATFDADSLCRIPDQIGDLEAATLPCAGVTAWNALFGARPLKAGDWVLAQGTGGVSLAALQWAKAAGARVVITSSSDAKLRRAKALGADVTLNYRTSPDWAQAALDALEGRGVDILVDVVGESQIQEAAKAVARDGVIAAVGLLSGAPSWGQDVGRTMVPVAVGNRDQHEAMLAFCADRGVRPVVDAVFDLERLPDALRLLESGKFIGKIAVNLQ